jgi:molybdopterin-synthase adenylyltransferase
MIRLIFPAGDLDKLRQGLWHDSLESAAILLCTPVHAGTDWRLVVRETHIVPDDQYVERSPVAVTVHPAFGLPVEKKASIYGWALIYCHTHPHQTSMAAFSPIDDESEVALAEYAGRRSLGVPHCALVFAKESMAARKLGTREGVQVTQIDSPQSDAAAGSSSVGDGSLYDRQIRAFGQAGQDAIGRLKVAIVGAGGTGSIVVQQLAHLGVTKFLLIDRDTIEHTNLNRTVGSSRQDVGVAKVALAERLIRTLRPEASVKTVVGDVVDEVVAREVVSADFIFCCTDSHASRHLLNQLSYQYAIPAIDMGVAIDASGAKVRFAGHVKALVAGQPCLWCLGNLNSRQIREEMMSPEQRQADPYFQGNTGVVQPSVISINSTVASVAVTMFLSMVTGLDAPARYLVYDGNRQRLAPVAAEADPNCNFCGPESSALGGDRYPLPVRRHEAS